MTAEERNKAIRQRVKDARPKLTQEQIATKRKASLRRLRITELVATTVLVGLLVYIQSLFPAMGGDSAPSEALFNTFLMYWGVYALYLAFMIRSIFIRFNHDYQQVSEDKKDTPFRGLSVTLFSPLIPLLILIPSFISGVFIDSATTTGDVVGISFFLLVIATIGSPLITVFIVLPIELLLRGIVAIVRRDTSRMHYALIGLIVAGLTAFIWIGSASVDASLPYPAGSLQVVLAILGIPGDYEVTSQAGLWVVRGIVLLYITLYLYTRYGAKSAEELNGARATAKK